MTNTSALQKLYNQTLEEISSKANPPEYGWFNENLISIRKDVDPEVDSIDILLPSEEDPMGDGELTPVIEKRGFYTVSSELFFTDEDIELAERLEKYGIQNDLPLQKAGGLVLAIERGLHSLLYYGVPSGFFQCEGILTHPGIPRLKSRPWDNMTAEEIVASIVEAYTTMQRSARGVYSPKFCVLPLSRRRHLEVTPFDDTSMLAYLESQLGIKFYGAWGLEEMVFSSGKAYCVMPKHLVPGPIQFKDGKYVSKIESKCSGVVIEDPKSLFLVEGI